MWTETYYNGLSKFYDFFAKTAYASARDQAIQKLQLPRGSTVLDLICGTGLNFPLLLKKIGPQGRIIGLDNSAGMLRRAQAQIDRNNWKNVTVIQEDARYISADLLEKHSGIHEVDGLVCFLGLSVVPDWQTVFARAFSLLRANGRCVVMDTRTCEGARRIMNPIMIPLVMLSAAADIRRPIWRLLDDKVEDLVLDRLTSRHLFARTVFVASGSKSGVAI